MDTRTNLTKKQIALLEDAYNELETIFNENGDPEIEEILNEFEAAFPGLDFNFSNLR
ncbi:MAG: hypothetical protein PHG08_00950 [Bacilli bacterium]|nr:hypothetical protein [Bacilli bacterium]